MQNQSSAAVLQDFGKVTPAGGAAQQAGPELSPQPSQYLHLLLQCAYMTSGSLSTSFAGNNCPLRLSLSVVGGFPFQFSSVRHSLAL